MRTSHVNERRESSTPAQRLTIIAVHGNGGGAFRFSCLSPHLSEAVRFQAITLPGFANKPRDSNLRTLADYARYIHCEAQQAEAPCVVLGHGIGASIILELLQRDTTGIDGVILHAPVGARLSTRWFPRLMALPGAREAGRRLFASRVARPLLKRLLFSQPVPDPILNQFFDAYRYCRVFSQMFDLITPAWFNTLRPVQMPSVLLWGERERVLSPDQMQDYLDLLPGCATHTAPHWDHFPMLEYPPEYAAVIVSLALIDPL
jgi:pimeloyl-ACP methyl ester carboxylesterase